MSNYEVTELGKIDEIVNLENGKVFLHDALKLTGCEISINCVPKGFKIPFNHKHKQNEEVYIFLKGEGVLTAGSAKISVREGSVLKIMPNIARTLENTSKNNLQFICVQAKLDSLEQFGLADAELC